MDIKSRIEQIISNNIEIGETENRLDYIVHNTSELADEIVKLFAIPVVSGSLPTSEELQEIVVKIAYSQQGEEQDEDCYAKMGMLHEFISKYVNGNDR